MVFYTNVEHWSLVNAIYFCVVTLGTVGYGDITPTTDAGKIFTVFYIIFGLAVIGGFFATLGAHDRSAAVLVIQRSDSRGHEGRETLSKEEERLTHAFITMKI